MSVLTSLETLNNGAAIELFNKVLEKVNENILDDNTEAKKKRVITLKVEITPNEERNFCTTSVQCDCKLQPIKAHESAINMFHDKRTGEIVMHSPDFTGQNPSQHSLPIINAEEKEPTEVVETSEKKTVANNVTKIKVAASN